MAEVKPNISIQGFQNFIETVYGPKNNRHYSVWDTLANIDRFSMRALKGIRKGDNNKTKTDDVEYGWTNHEIGQKVQKRF